MPSAPCGKAPGSFWLWFCCGNCFTDLVFECGEPADCARGGPAAGDGGPPGDGSEPPKTCASTSHRERVPRSSQRHTGTVHRLCGAATPVRDVTGVRKFRRAEAGCNGIYFCARHLPGNRLPIRHRPGIQSFRHQRGRNTEGRGSHDREKPEEAYAGKRSAGGAGCIFVSLAGDSSFVPAKHPARV
jgi:hypothetical protein